MAVQVAAPARPHYAWVILATGTLVVFAALGLARFGYSVILPYMQASLALNNTQAGLLATANLTGYVLFSVLGGALSARYGPRAVVAGGLALAGLGMLLTGLAGGLAPAALWRAVTGIGSGASNVPAMALLAAWFTPRRRGLAAGIAVGGSSLGLIVVGPLVPRLLSAFGESGWRTSWFLFGGTSLSLALLSAILLRNQPSELGLQLLGAEPSQSADQAHAPTSSRGLEWGRVYRSGAVWQLGLAYTAFGFAYIIYMTFFTKALIAEGGYSKPAAGNLFMLMGWFTLLSGLIWGSVSDNIGRKRAMLLVYLLQAAAYGLFALSRTPGGYLLSAALFGLTAWSMPAIMAATCGDLLGSRLAPAALGFITLFFGLGQALGPSAAGAIADAAGSFGPAFLLATLVALLGAGAAARLRPAAKARQN